jgi:TonB family protein
MQPSGHPYLLDEPERLRGPFAIALVLHAGVIALFVAVAVLKPPSLQMGEQTQGMGVAVTAVKTIPLPRKQGQVNPLANDTESVVPQEPLKIKEQRLPTPKQPEKAIELPTEKPPRVVPKPAIQYRPRDTYQKNQVFARTPEALKSPQVGMSGGGGVGIGPNSVFGYQFGAYAQQIRDLIAQKWNQAGVTSGPGAQAIISITIARNGNVSLVSGGQSSGSYTLDNSAKRAVLDASPLPPLPPGFPRDAANVDLVFQLQR